MSLVVERLGFSYDGVTALREVSVAARPGAITVLLGPNAAGKSTLLRCLIGAARPAGGRVLVDGTPAHQLGTRRLSRRIAYVPQRPSVAAAFTVREVVELGRYALPRDTTRIEQTLHRLELDELASRPFPALSVGQQQRVTLARALAQVAPDGHLILDEPTSAMDLRHVRLVHDLLREEAGKGVTVIVAMHDLTQVGRVADDAWILKGGRLEASGEGPEVLTPAMLERVFEVPFERVGEVLVPRD